MVTFVVKKKSVFFSRAAFQLFKFIQILFIYLPFSFLKEKVLGLQTGCLQPCITGPRLLTAGMWLTVELAGSKSWALGNDCVLVSADLVGLLSSASKDLMLLILQNPMESFERCVYFLPLYWAWCMRGPIKAVINVRYQGKCMCFKHYFKCSVCTVSFNAHNIEVTFAYIIVFICFW